MKNNVSPSTREGEVPAPFTRFLWWLSTAEAELLAGSVTDRSRYSIIGLSVLATWSFASLVWTYFFSTVMDGLAGPILLGLFMGFIILTIDRALIRGITRFNKKKFLPLAFRAVLAITIGTFMAQPAVLYLFDKEVRMQTSLDNEKRKQAKREELDKLYSNREAALKQQLREGERAMEQKYMEVSGARKAFIAETDGSGGTGKIGIKDIARAKQSEYQKLDGEYKSMQQEKQPILDSISGELASIEKNKRAAETAFGQLLNNGFLVRVEALSNLLGQSRALLFRYYLIVFLLVLIELMPVIAKTILPSGSYDEKVFLREKMEIALANSNILLEQSLKEQFNRQSYESASSLMEDFFRLTKAERLEKIRSYTADWKEGREPDFNQVLYRMKKDLLTRQEA